MSRTPPTQPRAALIIGGLKGIGRAAAERLAADGAAVAINYASDTAAAEETVAEIERRDGQRSPSKPIYRKLRRSRRSLIGRKPSSARWTS